MKRGIQLERVNQNQLGIVEEGIVAAHHLEGIVIILAWMINANEGKIEA